MGRLPHGSDLLDELTKICTDLGIECGRIEAIGTVQKAFIGYYDQKLRKYKFNTLDTGLEILKLAGNVSLEDGVPMVHAHITLADISPLAKIAPVSSRGTFVYMVMIFVHFKHGRPLHRPRWA